MLKRLDKNIVKTLILFCFIVAVIFLLHNICSAWNSCYCILPRQEVCITKPDGTLVCGFVDRCDDPIWITSPTFYAIWTPHWLQHVSHFNPYNNSGVINWLCSNNNVCYYDLMLNQCYINQQNDIVANY